MKRGNLKIKKMGHKECNKDRSSGASTMSSNGEGDVEGVNQRSNPVLVAAKVTNSLHLLGSTRAGYCKIETEN